MTTDNVFSTYDLLTNLAVNRPATPTVANGRLCVFQATDTGLISIWNGSAWQTTVPDYEEGTWTALDNSGASLTLTTNFAFYRKVGSIVFLNWNITYPSTISTARMDVGGLPFVYISTKQYVAVTATTAASFTPVIWVAAGSLGTSQFTLNTISNSNITNANLSTASILGNAWYLVN